MCLERNIVCTVCDAASGHLVSITSSQAGIVQIEVGKGEDSECPSAHEEADCNADAAEALPSISICIGIVPFGLQLRMR